jgi:short-subunit dehydrogenase
VLVARRAQRLSALADEIQARGGQALPLAADVTQWEQISDLVEAVLARYGRVDVLFNNAGFGRLKWLDQLDPLEEIAPQVHTNLLGLILTTRAVLPDMLQRKSGHIINMASVAGLIGTPTYSIYAATKFAVRGFTQALRREVGLLGVHVSTIYPGAVDTEFSLNAGIDRKTGLTTPAFLRLTPDEVAQAVLKVIERPRRAVVIPWPLRIAVGFNLVFPGLVDWVIERGFTQRERAS